mmetsp:Transcript_11384/g.15790  ORF Transcript_11384/g.15790 Transcript_11384/m.15790 type:complete len:190 (-) Transcript_11384:735-1304(-)
MTTSSSTQILDELFKFVDARVKTILSSVESHRIDQTIHGFGHTIIVHTLEGFSSANLSRTVQDNLIAYHIPEHKFKLHCELKDDSLPNPQFTVTFKAKFEASIVVGIKYPEFQVALNHSSANKGVSFQATEVTDVTGSAAALERQALHYFKDLQITNNHLNKDLEPSIQGELDKKLLELSESIRKGLLG